MRLIERLLLHNTYEQTLGYVPQWSCGLFSRLVAKTRRIAIDQVVDFVEPISFVQPEDLTNVAPPPGRDLWLEAATRFGQCGWMVHGRSGPAELASFRIDLFLFANDLLWCPVTTYVVTTDAAGRYLGYLAHPKASRVDSLTPALLAIDAVNRPDPVHRCNDDFEFLEFNPGPQVRNTNTIAAVDAAWRI